MFSQFLFPGAAPDAAFKSLVSSLLGRRFENHAVPLALKQLDRAACDPVRVVAVVVVGAQLTVRVPSARRW